MAANQAAGNMEQGTRNRINGPNTDSPSGFRNLIAWQKSHQLSSAVFRAVQGMPSVHRWLTNQTLRAAISVPANIAEGYTRGSLRDYARFLDIARGSLAELEYYLLFMREERLLASEKLDALDASRRDTGRVLHGLWRSLKQKERDHDWDHTGKNTQDLAMGDDEA